MRICDRDKKILELLWRCGGSATALQLTHQVWDQGKDNSRFRERLKRLADNGYIDLQPFPRAFQAMTLGSPRHCYQLGERGQGLIDRPHPNLDAGECVLRSEVIRQLNQSGYALKSLYLAEQIDGFYLEGSLNALLLLWCPGANVRLANQVLKQISSASLDPFSTSLLFAFSEVEAFLSFKALISTSRFQEMCPFECVAALVREALPISGIREANPFDGWYDRWLANTP